MIKLEMKKFQCSINRKAAKISSLSSGKTDKYEYLTGEEILPPDKRRVIELVKFTYTSLGKPFETIFLNLLKQTKTTEEQGKRQVQALKSLAEEELELIEGLFSKHLRKDEIKSEIDEIKKGEGKIKRKDLKYETGKYKYDFQKYETISSIDESIYSGKISIHKADIDQINLLENMKIGNDKSRLKT